MGEGGENYSVQYNDDIMHLSKPIHLYTTKNEPKREEEEEEGEKENHLGSQRNPRMEYKA